MGDLTGDVENGLEPRMPRWVMEIEPTKIKASTREQMTALDSKGLNPGSVKERPERIT